jgi:protein-disulfide isomerase
MQQVGFGGTPTFIIGDQILEGAVGFDALKAAVANARKAG